VSHPKKSQGTASVAFLRPLAYAASQAGVDIDQVFVDVGISPAIMSHRDVLIPIELARAAWLEAARRSGDDAFGLHAAEQLQVGSFDVIEYAARSSPTLGDALQRTARYLHLLTEVGEISFSVAGDVAYFLHHASGALRHISEMLLAAVVVRSRGLVEVEWSPLSVSFMHPQPADISEHQRIFRAPLQFGQPMDRLVIDRALLAAPLRTAEPELCALLDYCAEAMLAKRRPAQPLLSRVCQAIVEALPGGNTTIEAIAEKSGVSPRTLQRRLKEMGTSHQELLDQVRRDLAVHYLEVRHLAHSEIAFLLGFSDSSVFNRAFKRWTGTTPGRYLASGGDED
jgi:AraC-like DNA-binding protein